MQSEAWNHAPRVPRPRCLAEEGCRAEGCPALRTGGIAGSMHSSCSGKEGEAPYCIVMHARSPPLVMGKSNQAVTSQEGLLRASYTSAPTCACLASQSRAIRAQQGLLRASLRVWCLLGMAVCREELGWGYLRTAQDRTGLAGSWVSCSVHWVPLAGTCSRGQVM